MLALIAFLILPLCVEVERMYVWPPYVTCYMMVSLISKVVDRPATFNVRGYLNTVLCQRGYVCSLIVLDVLRSWSYVNCALLENPM